MGWLRRAYFSRFWRIWIGSVVFGNSLVLGMLTEVSETLPTEHLRERLDEWMLAAPVLDSLLCNAV